MQKTKTNKPKSGYQDYATGCSYETALRYLRELKQFWPAESGWKHRVIEYTTHEIVIESVTKTRILK